MSVTERATRSTPAVEERSLSGWGRTAPTRARVYRPRGPEDVEAALAAEAHTDAGVIARGAGCSYGDAAQNEGGAVLDMTGLRRIVSIDPASRLVRAEAGATIAELMSALAPHQLTVPVVPGTRHVTLAGAIASDIHGKNHHRDGAFARHVCSISLCTPAGGVREITPEADPELFYATFGGMGLTGVILAATLRAAPLPCGWVRADLDRTDGLAQTLELLAGEERHRYSVAWLDLLAEGASMGRALISRADPLAEEDAPPPRGRWRGRTYPATLSAVALVEVPEVFPTALLRPSSVRTFNALYWRASPRSERGRPLALAPYFFPLDVLGQWNRLYGAGGLIQYQFVVPAGAESALERCFELMRMRRLPVYLAVFKRFGEAFGGPLSFPLEGWTLAIDLPGSAPGLRSALQELDEVIASCGGRVYLSKDARLSPEALAAMYPELGRFLEQRAKADPAGVLGSDLGRRLGLCGSAA
jgi:decaprenylphospho-beta-D-ribofuranose 2-oxidase